MDLKIISNVQDDRERAFFASHNILFKDIKIAGPLDGESAFKECSDIHVKNSYIDLRYPFWHNTNTIVDHCEFTDGARAGFWYGKNIQMLNLNYNGIKPIRECENIVVKNSTFVSDEFAWRSNNIDMANSSLVSKYAFFECKNIKLSNVTFSGKYSYQYVEKGTIDGSKFDTKDAFWHSKDLTVSDTLLVGEYLGWYSENLTLVRCHIKGTQPLCYCKNLKLIDCTFEDADLALEYSEVNGNIKGTLVSIKNPLKGKLFIEKRPLVIIDENDRSSGMFLLECGD